MLLKLLQTLAARTPYWVVGGLAIGISINAMGKGNLGIGIALSGPSGVSIIAEQRSDRFYQGTVGMDLNNSFLGTMDYCLEGNTFGLGNAVPYWGIGASLFSVNLDKPAYGFPTVEAATATGGGARIPLGVKGTLGSTKLQLAGEIVPSLLVIPGTYSYVSGTLHLRYMFD